NNCQWRLRDIGTRTSELTKPAQGLLVPYNDEVPGLAILTTGGQTARFNNLPDDGFRDRCIFEAAHCQHSTNSIKCFHENYFLSCFSFKIYPNMSPISSYLSS